MAGYALVLALGLRKGKVLGLLWDDLDLEVDELTMGRQLQRVRHQLLYRETKTVTSDDSGCRSWTCALPRYATARFSRHQPERLPAACGKTVNGCSALNGALPSNPATSIALRRSYATWLVDDEVPPSMVQRVMGHDHVSTTLQLYVRRTEHHERIRKALGGVIPPLDDPNDDDGAVGPMVPIG